MSVDFRIYRPSPALARYVQCYYTLRGPANSPPQTIFPDGRMDLAIHLGDPFQRFHADGSIEIQSRELLVGQLREYVTIAPTGRMDCFGIRFRPGGSEALLRTPASETAGRVFALSDVAHHISTKLRDILESSRDQIAAVDRYLISQLHDLREQPAVDSALDIILQSAGTIPVHRLATHAGVSPRHLERVFFTRIGMAPKTFARIVRFQNVLRSPFQDWAAVAAECGYTDQAHLIHEFREFSGQTPAEWRAGQVAFLQDLAAAAS